MNNFSRNTPARWKCGCWPAKCGLKRIIREPTVNRPGLALSGFTRYFAYKRVQVMGHAEVFYLRSLRTEEREARYAYLFAYKIPCVVFSRGLKPDKEFMAAAEQAGVPIFQTPLVTMKFINRATLALEMMFAPRSTELGSMIDILGIGVIVRGESGIGKSEAVLALIERGYSLVADDVIKAVLVDEREVLCTSAELTRDHMEVRGIGIINVAAMFGVKSIRQRENPRPHHHPQAVGGGARRGPRGHGAGICEGARRGHSAHDHSRAAGPRHGAARGSRRLPDQVEEIRPQRRQNFEQPAPRANGLRVRARAGSLNSTGGIPPLH